MPIYPKRRSGGKGEEPGKPVPTMRVLGGPIRGYGPGKFNTILDSLVFELEPDETVGNLDELGVYWLNTFESSIDIQAALNEIWNSAFRKGYTELTSEEVKRIKESRVIILKESDDGFVYVNYYKDKQKGMDRWKWIEKLYSEFYEERGDGA